MKNKIQNNFVTKCCQDKGTFVKIREFVKIKEFDVCSQDFQKSCQDKGHSVKIKEFQIVYFNSKCAYSKWCYNTGNSPRLGD